MGQLKQLLVLGDKPLIRHCLDSIAASGISDIVVVLGQQGSKLMGAMKGISVKAVFNANPGSDMAESVRIGLRAIDDSATGVLIFLCDHPLVSPETARLLIHLHREDQGKIIIPVYNGKRGHPSLFPMPVLKELSHGQTLREVIKRDLSRIHLVGVPDEGVILDIDTMEDYRKISQRAIP
jgi:molybdenum cofactor cytidylyltransferase